MAAVNEHVLSVSDVNKRIKALIDSDRALSDICVRGELSNYKSYPSGHRYFSLKDEEGVLRGVMFKGDAMKLKFRPDNGMKVLVFGRVAVYPRDGQYQLYASEMIPDGVGELYAAFEQLKKKLGDMGYFDPARKRALPKYPERICIITSSAGAAVRDMLRILKKRWPAAEINILPVRVQGEEAPGEIAEAIEYACKHSLGEFIITGRGGGSMEDLWAFNDERVADAIFRSTLPVISAVGHEPDFTISDFVSDLRAATPSNAAELCVPDGDEIRLQLERIAASMRSSVAGRVRLAKRHYDSIASRGVLTSPIGYLRERKQRLLSIEASVAASIEHRLLRERSEIGRIAASLDALSPLKVLARGYAVATNATGKAIRSPREVSAGEKLTLRLSEGKLSVKVEGIRKKKAAEQPAEQLSFD